MTKKYKPYKSLFPENKKGKEKPSTAKVLKKAIRELYALKKDLRKLKEDEDTEVADVQDAIEGIEDILQDVVETLGATDPAVAALISTVDQLEDSEETDDFFEESSDDEEVIYNGADEDELAEADEEKEDPDPNEDEKENEEDPSKKESIAEYKRK